MTWVATKPVPDDGRYLAFYVTMHYTIAPDSDDDRITGVDGSQEFSTTVTFVPTVFPYSDCEGDECLGSLV